MAKVDLGPVFNSAEILVGEDFNVSGSVSNTTTYSTTINSEKTGYTIIGCGLYPEYDNIDMSYPILFSIDIQEQNIVITGTTLNAESIDFTLLIHVTYLQVV